MSAFNLADMEVRDLASLFVEIALEQERAELLGDIQRTRRLFRKMEAVRQELRARPGDSRRALLPLLQHENVQVQLKASKSLLAIEPEAARRVLNAISASPRMPQAGEAGMAIWALDQGIWVPT